MAQRYSKHDAKQGLEEARSSERARLNRISERLHTMEKYKKFLPKEERMKVESREASLIERANVIAKMHKRSEHDRTLHRWEIMNRPTGFRDEKTGEITNS